MTREHRTSTRINRVGQIMQKSTDSAYDFFFSDDINRWITSKKRTYARNYVEEGRNRMRDLRAKRKE